MSTISITNNNQPTNQRKASQLKPINDQEQREVLEINDDIDELLESQDDKQQKIERIMSQLPTAKNFTPGKFQTNQNQLSDQPTTDERSSILVTNSMDKRTETLQILSKSSSNIYKLSPVKNKFIEADKNWSTISKIIKIQALFRRIIQRRIYLKYLEKSVLRMSIHKQKFKKYIADKRKKEARMKLIEDQKRKAEELKRRKEAVRVIEKFWQIRILRRELMEKKKQWENLPLDCRLLWMRFSALKEQAFDLKEEIRYLNNKKADKKLELLQEQQ
ncbi:UNKNOWN [Stylonychia lemnae]|uniref:Uncharacterized protein n=1 Tax=Stylonychia lemnae TaxID=5949 RepID=A0A078ACP1_STYLE|nr:UNKNOWN [Stylonychia lemnae]|eukprot:CDW79347.1 UNKNOWN [Stylonychia lemnae]